MQLQGLERIASVTMFETSSVQASHYPTTAFAPCSWLVLGMTEARVQGRVLEASRPGNRERRTPASQTADHGGSGVRDAFLLLPNNHLTCRGCIAEICCAIRTILDKL